jgi:AcrR family transcriptional regulator
MPAALLPKDEVLDRLAGVFRTYSYEGATLARLSEATGLGRASLYHYFRDGKEGMARAVLERAGDAMEKRVLAPLQGPGTPRERLEAMARGLDVFYADGTQACLLGLLSIGDGQALFGEAVRTSLGRWIEAVAAVVAEAGLDRDAARTWAEDMVSAIQGALVMSRAQGSAGAFKRLVTSLPERLLADAGVDGPDQPVRRTSKRGPKTKGS